jgi:uncharacterized protein involved in exopolysaccharide biosynthesis
MGKSRQQSRSTTTVDNTFAPSMFHGAHLKRHARLFACVALLTALLGVLGALSVTPLYEGNMLIQINRSVPFGGAERSAVPAATEVEILRSRSIVSRVVNSLQLDIVVEPDQFPLIGAYLASTNREPPHWLALGGYVWGAERVRLAHFEVPVQLLRQRFTLTAGVGGRYTLVQKELSVSLPGKTGEPLRAVTRSGTIELLVSELKATPGSRFFVSRQPRVQVVEQLRKSLRVSENGRESNVIGVSLKGSRPDLISRILNEIGQEYVTQHGAQKSGENAMALAFHDGQLAQSRQRLQQLDDRLSQVLRTHGAADLNDENATLSQQSVALQARLAQAEQNKLELSSRFLDQHPAMMVANRLIQDIRHDLARIEARRRLLAAAQQEISRLTRDRQANHELSQGILRSRQNLASLLSADKLDVRIVDRAETPAQPVTLGLSVMLALACFAGLLAGFAAIVVKHAATQKTRQVSLLYMRDVTDRNGATVSV